MVWTSSLNMQAHAPRFRFSPSPLVPCLFLRPSPQHLPLYVESDKRSDNLDLIAR